MQNLIEILTVSVGDVEIILRVNYGVNIDFTKKTTKPTFNKLWHFIVF